MYLHGCPFFRTVTDDAKTSGSVPCPGDEMNENDRKLRESMCKALRDGGGCPRPDFEKAKCYHHAAGGWCHKVAMTVDGSRQSK